MIILIIIGILCSDFVLLSIVFRKFIPKLNRLDCYVPGWAMPVKDARTTPVLDGQWADW